MHAHDQGAGRHGLAAAGVEAAQMLLGLAHDGVDHGHKAHMGLVLQTDHVQFRFTLVDDGKAARRQQALGLQLFTAQADHHDLAAEVRVAADIAQRALRDLGTHGIDGHAAAIAVLQAHHVVHMGVAGQQLGLDAAHGKVEHPGHALHRGGDGQDVARAHGAVRIAVTLEGIACQRLQRGRLDGGDGQALQRASLGHLQQALVYPAAGGNGLERIADDHVVAPHLAALGNVHQRHLVRLRHLVEQREAGRQHGARRQPAVVGNNGHVVGRMHADGKRKWGTHDNVSIF
ncbi:hypothetical protein SDC9_124580 [bioreactor metagenome]|uniref:Uncharacterized protein n=1 Tax=bioreactor metagenome TaxID=1076179 RepID=A0A645CKW1_9ZZZZ